MPKPFAWSFSRLKNYRSCPKRHWHLDLAKDIKEPESDEVKWGHQVHEAFDNRIARGKRMPAGMEQYEKWAVGFDTLRAQGWTVRAEMKMAINAQFEARAFFDPDTWCRAVVDASAVKGKNAIAIDWKTGKIKKDYEQLAITAQMLFAAYPEVEKITTRYVWLADNKPTDESWIRAEMVPLWNALLPQVKEMEEAARTVTYPPKPGGLCVNYCPVTSCPYHGRGNR